MNECKADRLSWVYEYILEKTAWLLVCTLVASSTYTIQIRITSNIFTFVFTFSLTCADLSSSSARGHAVSTLVPYNISNGDVSKYTAEREMEHKELGMNIFPSPAGFSG